MYTLGKIFHVNFLVYAHWLVSIRISQMKDNSISVEQDRYATSIIAKYLDTATFKVSTKFYKTTFPDDMIFTKDDTSTSDEQVEKLNREFNIYYGDFIFHDLFIVYKSGLEFCITQVRKVFSKP